MRFKYDGLKEEYKRLDQRVQNALAELEVFSSANGLPEPMLTHIHRTLAQSADIYWREELEKAKKRGFFLTENEARKLAEKRFSFHMVDCAADLRDYIYSPHELSLVLSCLRSGRQSGEWEVLGHDVGSGHHLHIAYRDMPRYQAWRKIHG